KREDVKSHHYIISFDPRDGTDNGLTVDKAQSLGEEFCNEHFPGHQAIVCTHPDGHNHSGNIHVHIVINSLRIEAVPLLPY
ncbi:relaxase/mobilization nuclease domain-containing protein, partial [Roseburia intestinalis]